jgi:predicted negative regulator of RcsB-dependent stress response
VGEIHQQMMKELKTETPVKSISGIRKIIRYSVAVAASVLLVFVGIEGYNFYQLSPNKLYNENYTAYELSTTRDPEVLKETKIEKAFREKNFTEVIRLNANSVLTVKDIFLTGISFLETGETAKAISSFQLVLADVKDDNTSTLKESSEYYLALAYLKNKDFDQAIELMNTIQENPTHLYKSKFTRKYINRVKRLKWR